MLGQTCSGVAYKRGMAGSKLVIGEGQRQLFKGQKGVDQSHARSMRLQERSTTSRHRLGPRGKLGATHSSADTGHPYRLDSHMSTS